jgi:hypothetical protein
MSLTIISQIKDKWILFVKHGQWIHEQDVNNKAVQLWLDNGLGTQDRLKQLLSGNCQSCNKYSTIYRELYRYYDNI